jgi:hypothetical protein
MMRTLLLLGLLASLWMTSVSGDWTAQEPESNVTDGGTFPPR